MKKTLYSLLIIPMVLTLVVFAFAVTTVNAQTNVADVAVDPTSPLQSLVQTDQNGNVQMVPVLVFDVINRSNQPFQINNFSLAFDTSGVGAITNVYVKASGASNFLASVKPSSANTAYIQVPNNTAGAIIPANSTVPLTVYVNVVGAGVKFDLVTKLTSFSGMKLDTLTAIPVQKVIEGAKLTFDKSSAVVTGTSLSSGNCIVASNVVTACDMTASFSLTAGNGTLYVSSNPSVALATTSTGYPALSNDYVGLTVVTPNPSVLPGDSTAYYVVPAGSTRQFTYSGTMRAKNAEMGIKTFAITGISYGTDSTYLASKKITTGLESLKISRVLGTGLQNSQLCSPGYVWSGSACVIVNNTNTPCLPGQILVNGACVSTYGKDTIEVTSPNGWETWRLGNTYNITWKSSGLAAANPVRIGIIDTRPNGNGGPRPEETIAYSVPNTGSYAWTIPDKVGNLNLKDTEVSAYKIVVRALGTSNSTPVSDSTNDTFTIYQYKASNSVNNSCFQFNLNLSLGSRGADVVALQTYLIAYGFDIPAISSGGVAKGQFDAQTQAAVARFQAAKGIPSTGFVGPLTRTLLNMCPRGINIFKPSGGEALRLGQNYTIVVSSNRTVVVNLERKSPTDSQFWYVKEIGRLSPTQGTINWVVSATDSENRYVPNSKYKIWVGDPGGSGMGSYVESNEFSIVDSSSGNLDSRCPQWQYWSNGQCRPFNDDASMGTDTTYNGIATGVTVLSQLLNTTVDKAGVWQFFKPGTGNINRSPDDWNWNLYVSSSPKDRVIKRITVRSNTPGEVWSTGYSRYLADGTDLYGYNEHPYPLVVTSNSGQLNSSYDQLAYINGGPMAMTLYGQKESTSFPGGKVIVEFTDGTSASANIDVSGVNSSGNTVLVCPAGYICTPTGQTAYCPPGYICEPVTITTCPAGYTCRTMRAISDTTRAILPLVAACTGRALNYGTPQVVWSSSALNGWGGFQYSWNVYNDVSGYSNGTPTSASLTANYVTAGTKTASVKISDGRGSTATANCSVAVPAPWNSPVPTPTSTYSPTPTPSPTYSPTPTATPTPTPVPPPTASLTVEGVHSYMFNVGQTAHYAWNATNADTFFSDYTSNNPVMCGPGGQWSGATTQSGSTYSPMYVNAAGCEWNISFTAKNSKTGLSATDRIYVKVNPYSSSPSPTPTPSGSPHAYIDQNALNAAIWNAVIQSGFQW